MTAITHVVGTDTLFCEHCGEMLEEYFEPGSRVGVIKTTHGGNRIYLTGINDTNQPCTTQPTQTAETN